MTTRPIVRTVFLVLGSVAGLAITGGNHVKAYDIITTDPRLPPRDPTAAYFAQNPASYPAYGVTLPNPFSVGSFTNIMVTNSGQNELASFDATFSGFAIAGGSTVPVTLTGPVKVTTFGNVGQTTGSFAELMTSMDLTGMLAGHSVEIMLDPSQASTGQTTVTDISGGKGTLFDIHSFFDVFTELSLDHGAFAPASGGTIMSLSSIPEPSAWIMFITAGLIVPAAYARWGRRRAGVPAAR